MRGPGIRVPTFLILSILVGERSQPKKGRERALLGDLVGNYAWESSCRFVCRGRKDILGLLRWCEMDFATIRSISADLAQAATYEVPELTSRQGVNQEHLGVSQNRPPQNKTVGFPLASLSTNPQKGTTPLKMSLT